MKTPRTDKKVRLFDKDLHFYNDELYDVAKLAVKMGYKIHTFNPSGFYIKQIFVDNGNTFGSISENYSGVSYSTCHKSERGSGNGTGFGLTSEPMLASEEWINKCFIFAPIWATNTDKIKKERWEDHLKKETILKYEEIKL